MHYYIALPSLPSGSPDITFSELAKTSTVVKSMFLDVAEEKLNRDRMIGGFDGRS
jgi:hypothetical protein